MTGYGIRLFDPIAPQEFLWRRNLFPKQCYLTFFMSKRSIKYYVLSFVSSSPLFKLYSLVCKADKISSKLSISANK